MRLNGILLAATLLPALVMAACGHARSITEPASPARLTGPYTFSLSTSLSNTSGAPTINDAQILIDNNVEADSCPPGDLEQLTDPDGNVIGASCIAPGTSAVTLSATGNIGPGSHSLLVFISQQSTGFSPTPYSVKAFTFQVTDATGHLIKSVNLPAQTASLAVGQSIAYTFTLP
jgi:hypothetical protein